MSQQRYLWQYPLSVPAAVQNYLDTFSPVFQSVLFQRGISSLDEALDFLLPKPPEWTSETNLRNTDTACEIIFDSIHKDEIIAVYGDYDADGITSTALITLALKELGGNIIPYIPDRQSEGYGLNGEAIESLSDQGVSLLITVDNGIRSDEEISYANSLGLKVIVTDHHAPGKTIPPACALINPKLPDDPYPNKFLAGVGVAYKLICALSEHDNRLDPEEYLDLVAIGTVADIVPLVGENRYLVRQGLTRLNFKDRQSILSLLGAAGYANKKIKSSDISFQIAPRLNSSGRLDSESAETPLNLLLSKDLSKCSDFAQQVENHNYKRKVLSRELEKKIEKNILSKRSLPLLFNIFEPDIPLGLAGIAAGYLCRKYNIPAIVGQTGEISTTASCRSIPEFNIIEALDACKEYFIHYGGHSLAAGFTIENTKIEQFKKQIGALAKTKLSGADLQPALKIDAVVNLKDLNVSLYQELEKLEPTGAGNPLPVFVTKNLKAVKPKQVGKNSDHIKMVVTDGSVSIDSIGFGLGDVFFDLPTEFDLAYHLTINDYQGSKTLQVQIVDLAPS